MNKKKSKNIFQVTIDVNLMVENAMKIKKRNSKDYAWDSFKFDYHIVEYFKYYAYIEINDSIIQ